MKNNTSAKMASFFKLIFVFMLIFLHVIVHANPAYNRRANEDRIRTYDTLMDLAKLSGKDVAMQVDEELLRSAKQRQKRLSDQRRAELETLMALSKMTGKLVTVSRGGRQLDTAKIGRRRRSVLDLNLKNLRQLYLLSPNLGHKGNAAYPVIS